MTEEKIDLIETEKDIAIERLRQAPSTIKISFGMSGEFMNRDQLIEEVNEDTEIGKNIVSIQLAYLRAFKKELIQEE